MDDKKRGGSTLKEAFYKWSGLLIVILAALLFYFVISNFDQIGSVIKDYISILRPVVYGCVIAYILNPLMKTYNEFFLSLLEKKRSSVRKKEINADRFINYTCSFKWNFYHCRFVLDDHSTVDH